MLPMTAANKIDPYEALVETQTKTDKIYATLKEPNSIPVGSTVVAQ